MNLTGHAPVPPIVSRTSSLARLFWLLILFVSVEARQNKNKKQYRVDGNNDTVIARKKKKTLVVRSALKS